MIISKKIMHIRYYDTHFVCKHCTRLEYAYIVLLLSVGSVGRRILHFGAALSKNIIATSKIK